MGRHAGAIILACGLIAGAAGGYWYARPPPAVTAPATRRRPIARLSITAIRAAPCSGGPRRGTTPRDYPPFSAKRRGWLGPSPRSRARAPAGRILYYRNPMGLPDTSPVPKKDWMGMDYIPVYEGEEQDDGKTVKVSLDKIQRSGVRTEKVEPRGRAAGARRRHGQARRGPADHRHHALGRLHRGLCSSARPASTFTPASRCSASTAPDWRQIDLIVAIGATQRGIGRCRTGPRRRMQRLRNLGVPESRIREVRAGTNPRTLDWPAPATGDVIEKQVINGPAGAGGRRALPDRRPFTHLGSSPTWPKPTCRDQVGTRASVTVRAYPTQPFEGEVVLIYPELQAETRTAPGPHRGAQPGRAAEDRHVRRRGVPRRRRRSPGRRRPGERRHRQRHAPGGAGRQGRRPLRAAARSSSAAAATAMSRCWRAWSAARRSSPRPPS